MRNLLEETERVLDKYGKAKNDIRWIGGNDFTISIDEFIKLADVEYNGGYGTQYVATDLKIVGNNWWLERREYDGSEWWEYITAPEMPQTHYTELIKLVGNNILEGYSTLASLNFQEEEH